MAKHALFLAVTTTYVLSCRRRRQERRAELEKAEQMCELMEKELRVMTVDDGEQYTVPSLELLEHSLEAAVRKVRSEKDRKIGGEINYLENIVRTVPC